MSEWIYRVTLSNGETLHTGYKPLAEVWAKAKGAVLHEISMTVPPEQHANTPRWGLLPRLRKMASDFTSHPLSRGISECEEAGQIMDDAAQEIERLCRTRNVAFSAVKQHRNRVAQLESQRDDLIAALRRIDADPGNACHIASEAISEVCAVEAAHGIGRSGDGKGGS